MNDLKCRIKQIKPYRPIAKLIKFFWVPEMKIRVLQFSLSNPTKGRFPNQSDKVRKELTAGCKELEHSL